MTPAHPTPIRHLLYLHGFRSSPRSAKAQLMAKRVAARHPDLDWCCPQLPPSPRSAADLIQGLVADWPRGPMAVVGSSLGGFYARWLMQQTGCRGVLLNPAPFPARDLARHIGDQSAWHDPTQHFFFEPGFVNELLVLQADIARVAPRHPATPQTLLALVNQGDEVLDWREMVAFCAGGDVRLRPGGDHAISDFDQHLDAVFSFLGLEG